MEQGKRQHSPQHSPAEILINLKKNIAPLLAKIQTFAVIYQIQLKIAIEKTVFPVENDSIQNVNRRCNTDVWKRMDEYTRHTT
jgi:ABC-type uncharacterized transport system permease subunit